MTRAETSASGHTTTISRWLQLIQAEYRESPGLCLTRPEAERFWRLDTLTCEALFRALIDVKFLRQTDRGAYVRVPTD